jgi:hypothetical protein
LVIFVAIFNIFPILDFGLLHQGKSGNPVLDWAGDSPKGLFWQKIVERNGA